MVIDWRPRRCRGGSGWLQAGLVVVSVGVAFEPAAVSTIDLTGSYVATHALTGSYVPTLTVTGSSVPSLTVTGLVED